MIDLIRQGGTTMIPLFACSLIALTVVIERFLMLRKTRVVPLVLRDALDRDHARETIINMSTNIPSALSSIILGLTHAADSPRTDMTHFTVTLFKKEVLKLERGLMILEIVAAVTPLLGLLGTVLGMVDIFNVIAEIGVGQAGALSGGIAKALITTIVGLMIAIPALIFHSFFANRAEAYALELEEYVQRFVGCTSG